MKILSQNTCNYLDMQGFENLSTEEKSKLNIALRITPTLCSIVVVFGLYYANWQTFAALSTFGFLGTATRMWQPFDVLYNFVISSILKWPKLPPSPAPKRFACFIGFLFLIGGTISFYNEAIIWGYIFGTGYFLAAMTMATTHFCVGSWFWRKMAR